MLPSQYLAKPPTLRPKPVLHMYVAVVPKSKLEPKFLLYEIWPSIGGVNPEHIIPEVKCSHTQLHHFGDIRVVSVSLP